MTHCGHCGQPWGKWRETARLFRLDVPIWKHGAFDYLESIGLRFCIDFGTENAMPMARAKWQEQKQRTTLH
jgi:hypothetical protein